MILPSKSVPQANNLGRVLGAAQAVKNGSKTDLEIANFLGFTGTNEAKSRQGRYYRRAAQTLGLLSNENNNAALTQIGVDYLNSHIDNQRDMLIQILFRDNLLQLLLPYFQIYTEGIQEDVIVKFISSITNLAPSTAKRRFSTVKSWLKYVNVLKEEDRKVSLTSQELPLIEIQDFTKPLLPRMGELKQYEIVEERVQKAVQSFNLEISGIQTERANNAHHKLVNFVAERVKRAGGRPTFNRLIDLATQMNTSQYIFEMKSITDENASSQMRKGKVQLEEYKYLQNLPEAVLVLVIETLPTKYNWWVDFVETASPIKLLWDGNNELYASPKTREELAFLWQ